MLHDFTLSINSLPIPLFLYSGMVRTVDKRPHFRTILPGLGILQAIITLMCAIIPPLSSATQQNKSMFNLCFKCSEQDRMKYPFRHHLVAFLLQFVPKKAQPIVPNHQLLQVYKPRYVSNLYFTKAS